MPYTYTPIDGRRRILITKLGYPDGPRPGQMHLDQYRKALRENLPEMNNVRIRNVHPKVLRRTKERKNNYLRSIQPKPKAPIIRPRGRKYARKTISTKKRGKTRLKTKKPPRKYTGVKKNVSYYKRIYKYAGTRGIERTIVLNRARRHARYKIRKRRGSAYRTSKTKLANLKMRRRQKRTALARTRAGSKRNLSLTRQLAKIKTQIRNRKRITRNKRRSYMTAKRSHKTAKRTYKTYKRLRRSRIKRGYVAKPRRRKSVSRRKKPKRTTKKKRTKR